MRSYYQPRSGSCSVAISMNPRNFTYQNQTAQDSLSLVTRIMKDKAPVCAYQKSPRHFSHLNASNFNGPTKLRKPVLSTQ